MSEGSLGVMGEPESPSLVGRGESGCYPYAKSPNKHLAYARAEKLLVVATTGRVLSQS